MKPFVRWLFSDDSRSWCNWCWKHGSIYNSVVLYLTLDLILASSKKKFLLLFNFKSSFLFTGYWSCSFCFPSPKKYLFVNVYATHRINVEKKTMNPIYLNIAFINYHIPSCSKCIQIERVYQRNEFHNYKENLNQYGGQRWAEKKKKWGLGVFTIWGSNIWKLRRNTQKFFIVITRRGLFLTVFSPKSE